MNTLELRRSLAFFAMVLASGGFASAQSITGTFRWEVSGDQGATWGRTLDVPASQPSALVRLMVEWTGATPGERTAFAAARFDATVRGINCGGSDSATDFLPGAVIPSTPETVITWGSGGFGPPRPQRHGDVLKLDPPGDDEPPGLGARWTTLAQTWPGSGLNTTDLRNPVRIFQYTLLLDGSTGTRILSGVSGYLNPDNTPRLFLYFDDPATQVWQFSQKSASMIIADASITVVPAPGTLGLVGLLALPRRRR